MNPLLITLGVLAAVVVVANLHTLARMFGSLIFSHRRHLIRRVAKLDTIKAEGYLQTLKSEVNLMVEMVSSPYFFFFIIIICLCYCSCYISFIGISFILSLVIKHVRL